jgi:hypothetical protein
VTEIPNHVYWSFYEKYKCPGCQQNIDINQASFLWMAKHRFIPAIIRQLLCADIARLCGASGQDGREMKIDRGLPAPNILKIPIISHMQPAVLSTEDASRHIDMNIEIYELREIKLIDGNRVAIYGLRK